MDESAYSTARRLLAGHSLASHDDPNAFWASHSETSSLCGCCATSRRGAARSVLLPLQDHDRAPAGGGQTTHIAVLSPCARWVFVATNVAYFMAYPWYTHDECMRLPCLSNLNRWDREYGGCSLSIMTGQKAGTYANSQDTYCSKEVDKYDREICKYDQTELSNYRSEMVDDCWSGLPVNNIGYLIDNFCMPDITSDELSSDEQGDIDTVMDNCGYPS